MRQVIFAVILLLPSFAFADGFVCTVHEAYVLVDGGSLRRDREYELALVRKTFSVNRQRGAITGVPMDNASATEIRVLDVGSESSAFKVLSIRAKDDPHYLRIDIFKPSVDKPFVGYKGSEVFVGLCKSV